MLVVEVEEETSGNDRLVVEVEERGRGRRRRKIFDNEVGAMLLSVWPT